MSSLKALQEPRDRKMEDLFTIVEAALALTESATSLVESSGNLG